MVRNEQTVVVLVIKHFFQRCLSSGVVNLKNIGRKISVHPSSLENTVLLRYKLSEIRLRFSYLVNLDIV